MIGDDDHKIGEELHDWEGKAKEAVSGLGARFGRGNPDDLTGHEPVAEHEAPIVEDVHVERAGPVAASATSACIALDLLEESQEPGRR